MGMLLSRTTVRVQVSYKKWLPLGHFVLLVSRGVQVRNHHIYREIDHCEQEVRLLLHNGTGRDMCGSQRDPLGVSWCSPAPLELWTDTNGHIWQTQPKKGMITKGSDSQEMTVCTTSSGKPLGDWQVWEESKMGYWRRRWAPLAALGSIKFPLSSTSRLLIIIYWVSEQTTLHESKYKPDFIYWFLF